MSTIEVPEGYSLVSDDVLAELIDSQRKAVVASLATEEVWATRFKEECQSHEAVVLASHKCLRKLTEQLQALVVERTSLKEQYDALNQRHEALIQVARAWVPAEEHQAVIAAAIEHVQAGGQVVLTNPRLK